METVWTTGGCPRDSAVIREKVFVEEQGFIDEFDDLDALCHHLVLYDGGTPVATGRIYHYKGNTYKLGRIAVLKERRGGSVGRELMDKLEQRIRQLGGERGLLGAQRQAEGFYARCGYMPVGEEYDEQGCPHINMEKAL